jgi:hypothetical protein
MGSPAITRNFELRRAIPLHILEENGIKRFGKEEARSTGEMFGGCLDEVEVRPQRAHRNREVDRRGSIA